MVESLSMRTCALAVFSSLLISCGNQDAIADADAQGGNEVIAALAPAPPFILQGEVEAIQRITASAKLVGDATQAKQIAAAAMQKVLFDPESARFLSMRLGRNGSVCGKYNAKNRYGAYVGYRDFVVPKNGAPITSDANDGLGSLPANAFSIAYLASCATAKERSDYLAWMTPDPEMEVRPEAEDSPSRREYQEPDAVLDAPPTGDQVEEEITT